MKAKYILRVLVFMHIIQKNRNISKVNRKIKEVINNKKITASFEIESTGGRGYKFYGIKATKKKLNIE